MTASERACRRIVLEALSRLGGGHLELVEPDGTRLAFGDPGAELRSEIRLHSGRFYRAVLGGSVGLGEAYRDVVWDADDLVTLVRIGARNMAGISGEDQGVGEAPRGCLPSVEVIQRCVAGQTDLSTVWLEDIGAHYAETLRHWRERFVANADLAGELGYDEPFRRLWTLWLAMSEAGFRERRLRDVQMLFAKPGREASLAAAPAPAYAAAGGGAG